MNISLERSSNNDNAKKPKLTLKLGVGQLSETLLKRIDELKAKETEEKVAKKARVKAKTKVKAEAKAGVGVKAGVEKETKTEAENSNSKKWLLPPKIVKRMMNEFKTDFPNCFTDERRPLALNIKSLLKKAKPEYSHRQLGIFLRIYCGGVGYKKTLVLGVERVDLNGQVSSFVTAEQLAKDTRPFKKAEITDQVKE